jgi:hypothetical protein
MRRTIAGLTAIVVAATVLMILTPAGAASRYSVTVHTSTTTADVGQSFTLRGKVSPNARGQKVKAQRLDGSTWTTIKKAALNRRSKYAVTIAVTAPGDNRYRVVKPKSAGHKKGVSPTVTVVGWRWRDVTSLPLSTYEDHETHGITESATGVLLGTSYSPFITTATDFPGGDGLYRLDGMCTHLDVHVGGTPTSPTSDTSTARVAASLLTNPANVTESLAELTVSRDVDPFHVLRGPSIMSQVAVLLFHSDAAGTNGNFVGWGAAKVYCRS